MLLVFFADFTLPGWTLEDAEVQFEDFLGVRNQAGQRVLLDEVLSLPLGDEECAHSVRAIAAKAGVDCTTSLARRLGRCMRAVAGAVDAELNEL